MENTEQEMPPTTASVSTPSDMLGIGSELAMIKDITGGNPVVTIILAVLLVVGGPAGWKFWNNRQKLKQEAEEAKLQHELDMKKLELETQVKLAEIADDDDEPKKGRRKKK